MSVNEKKKKKRSGEKAAMREEAGLHNPLHPHAHMLLIFPARKCIYAVGITQAYFVPDLMTVLPECKLL